jgi:hypothetical protein
MKTKNVNFVDKYIEKIILALAVVFAGYVIWTKVMGTPYSVKIENAQVAPDEVEQIVTERAEALNARISSDKSPLPDMTVPSYTDKFKDRMAANVVGVKQYPVPLSHPGIDPIIVSIREVKEPVLAMPKVPPPANVLAHADIAVLKSQKELVDMQFKRIRELKLQMAQALQQTVDPATIDSQAKSTAQLIADDYAKLVPPGEPRDFRYVSVQGEFDVDAYRTALEGEPEDMRIPREWWASMLLLTDIQLERQMDDPKTGAWGAVEDGQFKPDAVAVIAHLPGQLEYRNINIESMSRQEAAALVTDIRASQKAITQPPFAPIKGIWLPPDAPRLELGPEDLAKVAKLKEDIQDLEEKIQARQRVLNRAKPQTPHVPVPAHEPEPRPGVGTPRGVAPAPAPRPAPTARPTPTPRPAGVPDNVAKDRSEAAQRAQAVVDRWTEELNTKKAELDAILNPGKPAPPPATDGLVPPGPGGRNAPAVDPYGGVVRVPGLPPGRSPRAATPPSERLPAEDQAPPADVKTPPLKIWAHDLTVRPNSKYRYRFALRVANPMFQRETRLAEEQKELAKQLSFASPPSPWSEPVTTEPEAYYFVTEVVPGRNEAVFEVWRIFNGGWQKQDFPVQPGDPIGDVIEREVDLQKAKLDMRIHAIMVDLLQASVGGGLGRTKSTVLFLDQRAGRLVERDPEDDRRNPDRSRLQNDVEMRGRVVGAALGKAPAGRR